MTIVSAKAVTAINGPVTAGTEGYLCFPATLRTSSRMHLTSLKATAAAAVAATGVLLLAGRPALGAAAGFIRKTLFGKEILFRCAESKFPIAIPAG